MPVTAVTCWIGALALVGTPFFAGFYSKDAIIEAVGESHRFGSTYAYWCVLLGVFVTALYTFRLLFMTFHGPERFREAATAHGAEEHGSAHAAGVGADDAHDHGHGGDPHESPAVVTVPLIALAIPSVVIGALTVVPVLFGNYYGASIFVLAANDVTAKLAEEFAHPVWLTFALHGLISPPFWLAVAGAVTAWLFFLRNPAWADAAAQRFAWLYRLLVQKYYFDWFNDKIITPLTRGIGIGLWRGGDEVLIDGAMVNGTAEGVSWFGSVLRLVQSGYLYSYAFWMMIGLAMLLGWFLSHYL
jgi:NADH-quinone oxidoreductase subunit L